MTPRRSFQIVTILAGVALASSANYACADGVTVKTERKAEPMIDLLCFIHPYGCPGSIWSFFKKKKIDLGDVWPDPRAGFMHLTPRGSAYR